MKFDYIHQWFEETAAKLPGNLALSGEGREVTYSELNTQADNLAALLLRLGNGGRKVCTMLPGSINLVTSLLAIFKAGDIYVPLSDEFSGKRLKQILEQCKPEALIISKADFTSITARLNTAGYCPDYLILLDDKSDIELYSYSADSWHVVPQNDDLPEARLPELAEDSYIFYTSGSTGEAKAILGSHRSLSHFIHWESSEFEIDDKHKVSHLVHPVFDASLRDIFLPLCTGSTLCIPDRAIMQNPVQLVQWIESNNITLIHCVPSVLRVIIDEIADDGQQQFKNLQYMLVSGEPLYVQDVRKWREKVGTHVELVNLYGTTETTLIKTFHRVEADISDDQHMIPVGKPISNTVVAIVNNQHLCQPGEIGEVFIKTPFWSKGYLFNEALNQQVFVQNPLIAGREDIVYKTGDLGVYLKNGSIEIKGRLDQQVKVNGIRVELGEVEHVLLGVEGVEQAVVTSHQDKNGTVMLAAYYTGQERNPEEIRQYLSRELNQNVIPGHIQYLKELPLTINGKVDRRALPKPGDLLKKTLSYEAVQGATEEKLEQMWEAILDMEKIGRNTSFFTIGGTSLKAIRLISSIYKEFGVMLKVFDIFSNPTIAKMALLLGDAPQKGYKEIIKLPASDRYPASFQQKRLWILDQFEKEQVTYNMPNAFELRGTIDHKALLTALNDVVMRHESLRTSFVMEDDILYQRVQEDIPAGFEARYIDVSTMADGEKEAKAILSEELNYHFDLSKAPLFRALVIRTSEDSVILYFNTHHIVFDAWSTYVMARDILSLYNMNTKPGTPALEPLKIQYKDYAAWLTEQLADKKETDEQFWLAEFENEIPTLNLPVDHARADKQTFEGSKYKFQLDEQLSAQIEAYCKAQDVTQFNLLLASLEALFYYYTGQKDVVLGIPVTGRHHNNLEDQIGFYVNTIAFRMQFSPDTTVSDFVKQVKKKSLKAYEHGMYPFDQLVDKLQTGSDISRSSLFDVMVQMQDTDLKELALMLPEDIEMSEVALDFKSSKFDLTFNFEVLKDKKVLSGWIEYNTALFEADTIETMQQIMVTILTEITEQGHSELTLKQLKQSLNDRFDGQSEVKNDAFSSMEISEDF